MVRSEDSYSYSRQIAWRAHAQMLSGNHSGYLLICSSNPLPDDCDDALRKSFAALGYGSDALTYLVATLHMLQPEHLYQLIEALDPGIIVTVDDSMRHLVMDAYHLPSDNIQNVCTRVGGRPAALFSDMPRLMQSEAGHQKIWAALKTMPKRER